MAADLGFIYCPPVAGARPLVTASDQDWPNVLHITATARELLKNIAAFLAAPASCR